jgi:ABC-type lipoprotein export system ATPase subunit
LLPQCTVLENVLMPTLPLATGEGRSAGRERADRLLARAGLEERRDFHPALLSGGERQRTAVVRALINSPKLLLADEPTGSLDEATADRLVRLLVELNREENLALVVVTHSPAVAAHMDRHLHLHNGRLTEA